jgi:hypothetical protein
MKALRFASLACVAQYCARASAIVQARASKRHSGIANAKSPSDTKGGSVRAKGYIFTNFFLQGPKCD